MNDNEILDRNDLRRLDEFNPIYWSRERLDSETLAAQDPDYVGHLEPEVRRYAPEAEAERAEDEIYRDSAEIYDITWFTAADDRCGIALPSWSWSVIGKMAAAGILIGSMMALVVYGGIGLFEWLNP